jgi:ribosomal-protein-alanine N-acetyltransferase
LSTTTLDRIETARMVCERLRPDHAPELAVLLCDPRVARTLWPDPEPPSEADVAAGLAPKLEHWQRYGFGLWLLRDRSTGEMVGRGGLQYTFVAETHEIEGGWAIVPERWGQGLATELALASLEVAFGPLGLPQIVAFTLPHNVASRRVMEKSGFRYEREIEHVGLPHVLYRCRAARLTTASSG